MIGLARTALAAALGLLLLHPAAAGYREGLAAFKRGDYEAAYREIKPLADQGLPAAQNDLGFLYYQGWAVDQSHREAARWYYRAAKQGLAAAQNNLAFLYENGEGVDYDERRARAWYLRAARQGHAGAQFNLGLMYQHGRGGKTHLVEAYKWFTIAAERLPAGKAREAAARRQRMVADRMTAEQISKGERRARDWIDEFGRKS